MVCFFLFFPSLQAKLGFASNNLFFSGISMPCSKVLPGKTTKISHEASGAALKKKLILVEMIPF